MKNKIIVIDAICGAGKTSWAIQYMNKKEAFNQEKIIYVTPFLKEIDRVIQATHNKFKQPSNKNAEGSKLVGLRRLVANGSNIVCSHELFKLIDRELIDDIEKSEYTLILDEVMNVINQIDITKNDLKLLVESNIISLNDDTTINWMDDSYDGKFNDMKNLAKRDNLYLLNNTFLFWTLDKNLFNAFSKIYIMTYLFDGQIQKYYYDLHEFEYEKMSVIKKDGFYELVDYDMLYDNRYKIAARLNIYEDKGKSKLNSNFCDKPTKNMFSSTWLKGLKKYDSDKYNRLSKNIRSFLVSNGGNTKNSFWTTIKEVAPLIKCDRATYYEDNKKNQNFVSVSIRATNTYRHCINAVYIFNRYMNPLEKAFFNYHGIEVDEDLLAVSDLIQFLFRGVIRQEDSEEIMNVYLPSIRMRKLLYKYLSYEI